MVDRDELVELILKVRDRGTDDEARLEACRRLASRNDPGALEALYAIAETQDENVALSRAAGSGIAEILWRLGRHQEAVLADFGAEAYLAFDDTIAQHLRR